MANAVAARIFGDDYQALVFWLEACKMLIGEDDIEYVDRTIGTSSGFSPWRVFV